MDKYIGSDEEKTAELTKQEKVISLYKFIRELSASKQKVVLNVKNYDWYCDLSSIPQDTQNIEVFYRDRVEEERTDTGTALLRVHKPEFQKCPEPDASLLEWLVEGWTSFRNEVHIRKTIEHKVEDKLSVIGKLKNIIETKSFFDEDSEQKSKDEEDTVIVERFEDEESRVNAYKKWLAIRSEWVEKQKIIDQTRGLFTKLYQIHVDLERDSETIEMVVANGYLRDKTNWDINHPVMTRRVKTKYDPIANTMSIEDTEVETELYTMLLHTMGDINLDSINSLRGDLYKNDYHPMDRNRFDVIIVDEASQSDVCSLAIAYMAKKLIVVGDDKQVSPMAVGTELDKINALIKMYLDGVVPNAHLYTPTTSLYDVAGMTFQSLLLKEHFRCVPEIIGFSNGLSYDFKIKPLRDASSSILLPAVVNYRVADGERDAIRKENTSEAKAIVALLMACMEQPEYAGKTFGVISMLGDEQAKLIQSLIFEHIDAKDIERRRILCGNASNFQGDQRDVVLLSIVDSNSGSGPLKLQDFGPKEAYRKRYNVAASRAKDQMWVVDSLDSANDLKPGDIRKQLIDYSLNPAAFENTNEEIEKKSESPFEASVARTLTSRGYHLIQQWEVGAYRLDMVAVCGKKCVAIECDGERWHSGEAKIREDMERQTILERIGWRFIRIRGSEYYRNPDATMERVISELGVYGIDPEDQYLAPKVTRTTELLQRTKARAATILSGFDSPCSNGMDLGTIAFALNTKESEKNVVPAQKHDVMEDDNQTISRVTTTESIPAKQIKEPAQITVAEIVNNRNPDEEPKTASTIGSVHTLTVISEPSAVTESKQKHDENGTHTVPQKSSKDLEELTVPTLSDERPASNDVIALITTAGIEYVDKRNNGGALWIIGNQDDLAELVKKCKKLRVYFTFKAGGGRATKNRDGWWAK